MHDRHPIKADLQIGDIIWLHLSKDGLKGERQSSIWACLNSQECCRKSLLAGTTTKMKMHLVEI